MRLTRCIWFPLAAALPVWSADLGRSTDPIHFVGFTNFAAFDHSTTNGGSVMTSPWVRSAVVWNELIASWNADCPDQSQLQIEVRAARGDDHTPFYTMGLWAPGTETSLRQSVKGQKDAQARVKTDVLVCRQPMDQFQVRLTLRGDQARPRMKMVGVCLLDSTARPMALPANRAAWGTVIDVPQRSQLGYPGGSGWCSPTSVSMILAYWAGPLHRPELNLPVPTVARSVNDPNWPGTGNWPFNTAFAGQFDGLRAYVTRFDDLAEVEDWIAAGVPVALSVSFDLLNGKPRDQGNGHLIVVVGFTKAGDVVVNDPWPHPRKENSVRKVFPRKNVLRAWQRSRHTVYLIYPESVPVPKNRFGHWME